jgi:hypothetical protein
MQNVVILKKLPVKGLSGMFLSVGGSESHTPTPLHTVYVYTVYVLINTGEGAELNQRGGERGNKVEYRSHSWVENTSMSECTQEIGYLQSINTCRKVPLEINLFR